MGVYNTHDYHSNTFMRYYDLPRAVFKMTPYGVNGTQRYRKVEKRNRAANTRIPCRSIVYCYRVNIYSISAFPLPLLWAAHSSCAWRWATF